MLEVPEARAECPSCSAIVSVDATECPRCGELFAQEPSQAAPPPAVEEVEPKTKGGFREKLLFYMGILLILLGGPAIALGSWLHDILRIPFGEYAAFDVFGPVNRLVSALGLIVLIVGIVFLVLSLRLTRPDDAEYDLGAPRSS